MNRGWEAYCVTPSSGVVSSSAKSTSAITRSGMEEDDTEDQILSAVFQRLIALTEPRSSWIE
jgi:hypothetical protein